jgi:hypothetical protein
MSLCRRQKYLTDSSSLPWVCSVWAAAAKGHVHDAAIDLCIKPVRSPSPTPAVCNHPRQALPLDCAKLKRRIQRHFVPFSFRADPPDLRWFAFTPKEFRPLARGCPPSADYPGTFRADVISTPTGNAVNDFTPDKTGVLQKCDSIHKREKA